MGFLENENKMTTFFLNGNQLSLKKMCVSFSTKAQKATYQLRGYMQLLIN